MITLHFSSTSALSSEAIKIFERGWCSHVDAVLPDGHLLGARSDAIGGKSAGVQVRPPAYEVWDRTEVVGLPCAAAQEASYLSFLVDQIGKPYDELAILAFAVRRDWRSQDAWFCSELITAALEKSWFSAPLASVSSEVTPRDLLMIVSPWATS